MLKVYAEYTLDQFNADFGTALTSEMSVEDFTDELERTADITYYYASYNLDDIATTAQDEDYDASKFFVYLIGDVYVATTYSV